MPVTYIHFLLSHSEGTSQEVYKEKNLFLASMADKLSILSTLPHFLNRQCTK